jgi:hypothetical protein
MKRSAKASGSKKKESRNGIGVAEHPSDQIIT